MGTIRNGAIIMVRTAPRPKKLRLSSSEIPRPSSSETPTTVTVSTMVKTSWERIDGSVKTVTKLLNQANPNRSGRVAFQLSVEMTSVIRNGSWVKKKTKMNAGSRGTRRLHPFLSSQRSRNGALGALAFFGRAAVSVATGAAVAVAMCCLSGTELMTVCWTGPEGPAVGAVRTDGSIRTAPRVPGGYLPLYTA